MHLERVTDSALIRNHEVAGSNPVRPTHTNLIETLTFQRSSLKGGLHTTIIELLEQRNLRFEIMVQSLFPQFPQKLTVGLLSVPHFTHFFMPSGAPQLLQNLPAPEVLPQLGQIVCSALKSPLYI